MQTKTAKPNEKFSQQSSLSGRLCNSLTYSVMVATLIPVPTQTVINPRLRWRYSSPFMRVPNSMAPIASERRLVAPDLPFTFTFSWALPFHAQRAWIRRHQQQSRHPSRNGHLSSQIHGFKARSTEAQKRLMCMHSTCKSRPAAGAVVLAVTDAWFPPGLTKPRITSSTKEVSRSCRLSISCTSIATSLSGLISDN